MRNIRLAVLLCDEFVIKSRFLVAEYGGYQQIFHEFLSTSLETITSDVTFTLDGYDVVNDMTAYPPEGTHYDGILISGSRSSVNDNLPWVKKLVAYAKYIITEKPYLKIFGICFGHQIIFKALGGTIKRGKWEISVTTINPTCLGKAIFRAHSKLHLQLFHHDQVSERAPHASAYLLGSSVLAHNQGTVIFDANSAPAAEDLESDTLRVDLTSIHVLTLQGHPEFTGPIMLKLIELAASELPPNLVDDAIARAMLPTDAIDKGWNLELEENIQC